MLARLVRRITLLFALCVASCLAPSAARATDHTVPGMHPTIQAAINAASQGDRIVISPGTYTIGPDGRGWLWIDKSLTLMSATGQRDVFIHGSFDVDPMQDVGDSSYVEFDDIALSGEVDVEGITPIARFTDCSFTADPYGAIILQGGTYGTFQSCEWNGGGILVFDGEADVSSCAFQYGAGVALESSWRGQYSRVMSSTFKGGGFISGNYDAACSVGWCDFHDGGGISGYFLFLEIGGCAFLDGAGIDAQYAHVEDSTFQGPGACAIRGSVLLEHSLIRGYGVGIAMDNEYQGCTVSNSLFAGNGIGILAAGNSMPEIFNSTIAGNQVGLESGDAMYARLQSCIVWGNATDIVAPSVDSDVRARYCLVGNWQGTVWVDGAQPLLTYNPRFVRRPAAGADGVYGTPDDDLGDLHLQSTSPCIDRGEGVAEGTDLDGLPRTNGKRVDIGAYEYRMLPLTLYSMTPAECRTCTTPNVALSGTGFLPGCSVSFGGELYTPVYLSDSSLRFTLRTKDTALAGLVNVQVLNPDGTASLPLVFTVANPKPVLHALSPSAVDHGSSGFLLFVSGDRITPTSTVYWNGSARPTFYNALTGEIYAQISASDVAVKGRAAVTVVAPGPGGGVSNVKTFTVR